MKRAFRAKRQLGFTLIEIMIVMGIITILAAIVLVAVNPAKQFAQSRNVLRSSNVNAILNAIGQRVADNKGIFEGSFGTYTCPTLPTTATVIYKGPVSGGATGVDLSCLVPTFIPLFPTDPKLASGDNTGYTVVSESTGRITVCAPGGVEPSIPDSAAICVTR